MSGTRPKSESMLVGSKAPAFSLPDQDGKVHALTDYKGRWVILFFYPRDSTPGCTKEACGFRDNMKAFRDLGVVVLGLSILDAKSKKKFADKHQLDYPLLADEDHKVCEAYGVWMPKKFMGREFLGVRRETFAISPDGTIAMHWPDAGGSEKHSAEVLAWLKQNAAVR